VRSASTLPRIQRNVVMISASREEGSLRAPPLRDFESEHAAVERERPFEIGHLQVNVTDSDGRINRAENRCVHVVKLYEMAGGMKAAPQTLISQPELATHVELTWSAGEVCC
jgi:hypothetical protein